MDNQPGTKNNNSEHDDIYTTYNDLSYAIDDYIKELKKVNLPLSTSSAISKEDVIVIYDIIIHIRQNKQLKIVIYINTFFI